MTKIIVFECARCKQVKPLSEFRKNHRLKRGHYGTCCLCQNDQSRKTRERTKKEPCSIDGCLRGQMACGFCAMHYVRLKTHGSVGEVKPKRVSTRGLICRESHCDKPVFAGRRCKYHYHALRETNFPICTVDGCDEIALTKARGLCTSHDRKMQRWGDPLGKPPKRSGIGTVCSIDDCPDVVVARGWCAMHYGRWVEKGDANWEPVIIPDGTVRPDRGGYVLIKATGHSECRLQKTWAPEQRQTAKGSPGRYGDFFQISGTKPGLRQKRFWQIQRAVPDGFLRRQANGEPQPKLAGAGEQ